MHEHGKQHQGNQHTGDLGDRFKNQNRSNHQCWTNSNIKHKITEGKNHEKILKDAKCQHCKSMHETRICNYSDVSLKLEESIV